jgi:hypothetical protein
MKINVTQTLAHTIQSATGRETLRKVPDIIKQCKHPNEYSAYKTHLHPQIIILTMGKSQFCSSQYILYISIQLLSYYDHIKVNVNCSAITFHINSVVTKLGLHLKIC